MDKVIKNEHKTVFGFDYRGVLPIIALGITLLTDLLVPNSQEAKYRELTNFRDVITFFLVVSIILFTITLFHDRFRKQYSHKGWFVSGFVLFVNVINIVTVKYLLLPQIYFPSLNRILNVYIEDRQFLFQCMGSSFSLLIEGLIFGTVAGVFTGILVGWSLSFNYWIYPVIRILGPIPSSTWIPLALVLFPTPRWAAVFLIAFGVWFQITILTSSGIQSVKKSYFEVSSTLGASNLQNLFHIAIPDALPSIFLGFFNATCSSFVALMAAEMLGVKAGIGWYINWQKEMISYPNVYAGLILIAVFCYLFITLQFKVRDKLLGWQKGVIKW
ncbi:ABC transporter permease subunit [Anaerocolumna sp. AGMB13025]|uniref:ABC transporter permease n=1 Tax=Anaerocolumna sp. AGMB13025 TaxID=3039116 RepID=UPI00241D7464|nr:ABC transporter permease subunit [Anaerocolumna sp. AGMB13025]WFR54773.1 ABC transporter permease subunit [Anaerocolumna sp. AGMB13025]